MAIDWQRGWQQAMDRAQKENKRVLLDFFSPHCIGCAHMASRTYGHPQVQAMLNRSLVPLQLSADSQPYSERYLCRWTPHFLLLDASGQAHLSQVGFLGPEQMVPWLLLGQALAEVAQRRWPAALALLKEIIDHHPRSLVAAKAVFWQGAAARRHSGDDHHLRRAHDLLQKRYPDSAAAEWAKPYQDL